MVARLALLCLAEIVVVILLAMQVFADHAPPPAAMPSSPAPRSTPEADAMQTAPHGTPDEVGRSSEPRGELARQQVTARWRPEDPVGVLLTGTLRLRNGAPVDANVAATLDKDRRFTSSTKGSYALMGLRPGEWQVSLRGESVVTAEHTVTITDEAVQRRDFALDASFPVRVTIVTPDGEDATVAMRRALPQWTGFQVAGQSVPFPERLAPTDHGVVFVGDAHWDAEMNPREGFAGTLHLDGVPAHVALLSRHLVLEQQLVEPGQKEVKFVVDVGKLGLLAGSATVRVLDAASGEPLHNAQVSLSTSNVGGGGRRVDEHGTAVVEGVLPGLLRCQITARDRESYFHTVRVEPGQRLDLGEVRLGPALQLTGTVLGPDGKAAGARLTWTELRWRSSPAAFRHDFITKSEADGTFALWGTGRGPIAVQARGADGLLAAGVFDNPPAAPVVLRLAQPGECVVTRPLDPARGFTVTVLDDRQRPIAGLATGPRHEKRSIHLPAGDYTFQVHDDRDRLVQSGSLTFGPRPCEIRIR